LELTIGVIATDSSGLELNQKIIIKIKETNRNKTKSKLNDFFFLKTIYLVVKTL